MKKAIFCICVFSITSLLTANDHPLDQKITLPAGKNSFSLSEHIAIQEQRALQQQKALEENRSEEMTPLENLQEIQIKEETETDESQEERISHGLTYFTSHPEAIHFPILLWNNGEKVELQDGSIWKVAYGDRWKLASWLTTDMILILPNHSFFSFYDYKLANARTGDYVRVNLSEIEVLPLDPTFLGQRLWILGIDYMNNIVYLCDGSTWSISIDDSYLLSRWAIGDVLFIGVNDNWDAAFRPNILINFNSLKYIRANCVN